LFIGQLTDRSVCRKCAREIRDDLDRFTSQARALLAQQRLDDEAWQQLVEQLRCLNVPLPLALQQVEPESLAHLERFLRFSFADAITEDTLQTFRRRASMLQIPDEQRRAMQARLEQGYRLSRVRAGNLPNTRVADIFLDSDEQCHIYVSCPYERQLQRRVETMAGQLLLTNKKFRFIGYGDGWELPWTKLVDVEAETD
jgi:hypothetical protein